MTWKELKWLALVLLITGTIGLLFYFTRGMTQSQNRTTLKQQTIEHAEAISNVSENVRNDHDATSSVITINDALPSEVSAPHYVEPLEKIDFVVLSLDAPLKPGAYPQGLTWKSVFFHGIDELTKNAQWPLLREVGLPADTLEVRVWLFDNFLTGFRFYRIDGKWTGLRADQFWFILKAHENNMPDAAKLLAERQPLQIVTPQTAWTSLWEKLETLGILTLPDSTTLPNGKMVLDGVTYVVEINDGGHYRTYMYGNPQLQDWPEARQMQEIINTLEEEFQ